VMYYLWMHVIYYLEAMEVWQGCHYNRTANTYTFKVKGRNYTLTLLALSQIQTVSHRERKTCRRPCFFIETHVERFISKGKPIYALLVVEKGEEETPLHPLTQPLIHEFMDVFPNDLPPGLPPIRRIEYQIDLLLGASLPNKAAYRCNLTETKELQRQV